LSDLALVAWAKGAEHGAIDTGSGRE